VNQTGCGELAQTSALFSPADVGAAPETPVHVAPTSEAQTRILEALEEPRTLDQLAAETGLSAGMLRAEITVLEIHQRVRRVGSRIERRA